MICELESSFVIGHVLLLIRKFVPEESLSLDVTTSDYVLWFTKKVRYEF